MLAYHPAFDIYHCCYRILLCSDYTELARVEIDRVRIWDFYFTFPYQAKRISFPRDLSHLRPKIELDENPYEFVQDPLMVFERMRPFQLTAIRFLFGHGFFEQSDDDTMVRSSKPTPSPLVPEFSTLSTGHQNVLRLISSAYNQIPLFGPSGLKARTNLIDYRYDPI